MLPDTTKTHVARNADGWFDLVSEGRRAILTLLLLGCWVVAVDSLVVATILPSVGASLGGFAWFGAASAIFLTGLVVAAASSSWLADRVGLRTAMLLAGLGFAAGCGISAAGDRMAWFVAGRAVQGCAAGWVSGLIYISVATYFPGRHLPRVLGLCSTVWAIASLAGPLLGGLFADSGLWRGVFWLFAGQGGVFAIVSYLLLPESDGRRGRPNHGGFPGRSLALLAASIGALSIASAIIERPSAISLAVVGAALLVATVRIDRRQSGGVIPRQAVDPVFPLGSTYLVYFFAMAAGTAFALYVPMLLQQHFGLSSLEAGYIVAIEALTWTVAALAFAGIRERWQTWLIVIGPSMTLAGTILNMISLHRGGLTSIALGGAALGAGCGLCFPFIGQRIIGAFDDADRRRGSSAISAARNAGGAFGAAIAGIAANIAGSGNGMTDTHVVVVISGALGSSIPLAIGALFFACRTALYRPERVFKCP